MDCQKYHTSPGWIETRQVQRMTVSQSACSPNGQSSGGQVASKLEPGAASSKHVPGNGKNCEHTISTDQLRNPVDNKPRTVIDCITQDTSTREDTNGVVASRDQMVKPSMNVTHIAQVPSPASMADDQQSNEATLSESSVSPSNSSVSKSPEADANIDESEEVGKSMDKPKDARAERHNKGSSEPINRKRPKIADSDKPRKRKRKVNPEDVAALMSLANLVPLSSESPSPDSDLNPDSSPISKSSSSLSPDQSPVPTSPPQDLPKSKQAKSDKGSRASKEDKKKRATGSVKKGSPNTAKEPARAGVACGDPKLPFYAHAIPPGVSSFGGPVYVNGMGIPVLPSMATIPGAIPSISSKLLPPSKLTSAFRPASSKKNSLRHVSIAYFIYHQQKESLLATSYPGGQMHVLDPTLQARQLKELKAMKSGTHVTADAAGNFVRYMPVNGYSGPIAGAQQSISPHQAALMGAGYSHMLPRPPVMAAEHQSAQMQQINQAQVACTFTECYAFECIMEALL